MGGSENNFSFQGKPFRSCSFGKGNTPHTVSLLETLNNSIIVSCEFLKSAEGMQLQTYKFLKLHIKPQQAILRDEGRVREES